ncbi:MAG: hypothetical protein JO254_09730 [Pseudolabrys sp.]|nr:hypothetical protein [Pseudolabrys sp.]
MRIRILATVLLVGLSPVLSACADFDMDKLDVFNLNEKKKLPGERRAVFPEGVPGVSQGVPPELVKGYQAPPEAAPEPEPKTAEASKPKRPAKPRTAVQPASQPAQITVQPGPQQAQPQSDPAPAR